MSEPPAAWQHRGSRAVAQMVEYAPATGGLALWVRHQNLPPEPDGAASPALICTDGHTVFYSAAFEHLPLAEQVGLVAHEVLHIALRHAQRFLDLQQQLGQVSLPLFNLCADAIVNSTLSHLSWLKLPSGALLLERLLKTALNIDQPVEKSLLQWDVEDLYRAVDDRQPQFAGKSQGQRQAGGAGQSDQASAGAPHQPTPSDQANNHSLNPGHKAARVLALGQGALADLLPGPETQASPETEAEAAQQWSERIVRAHAGDGAYSMLRALLADLPRSHTPWEQVLRTRLARSLANQPELSWSRPARSYLANQGRMGGHRMPFEPGTSPQRSVPRLVLVVDVSGSIQDTLLQSFTREIEAISRRLGAGVTLVLGDDRVRSVTTFQPGRVDLGSISFQGGGGTDFTPLLEEAQRQRPDLIVVLTDLDGPARFRPRAPVLWALPPAAGHAEPPFGRKLVLR